MDIMWRPSGGGQSPNERGKDTSSTAEQQRPQSIESNAQKPSRGNNRPRRGGKATAVGVVIIAVLALAAGFYMMFSSSLSSTIDSSRYQAVFLSNGQVYFGKLEAVNRDYMKLTDIYYLQSQQSATDVGNNSDNPQDSSDGNVQLIKLGEEIHGPEDEMIVAKEHLLFFENLRQDGNVTRSINQHKNSR
jgi:hypothetical protein